MLLSYTIIDKTPREQSSGEYVRPSVCLSVRLSVSLSNTVRVIGVHYPYIRIQWGCLSNSVWDLGIHYHMGYWCPLSLNKNTMGLIVQHFERLFMVSIIFKLEHSEIVCLTLYGVIGVHYP